MKNLSRSVFRVIVICLLVFCFLFQMWEQFDKFLKEQTTVAMSYERRQYQKFPTFALCDSRGYKEEIVFAGTAARYNETTFDIDGEIKLYPVCTTVEDCIIPNVTMQMVATTYNGYCKLFEFHESYDSPVPGFSETS